MNPEEANEIVKNLRKRVIKSFLDLFVLTELQERPLSGYDIITLLHERFGFYFSPGTVYALLFSLERDGLVTGNLHKHKRVYALTVKGEQTLKTIANANEKILSLLRDVLGSGTS